jgi:MFS transporter, DHA1 family, multidrug resistance protein
MKFSLRMVSVALFSCVFLAVFTEVLLSPFYPQFFRQVFGVEDLSYTGYYIFICRLTVVLCAPIWGLLSRRFAVKQLLMVGQAGAALVTALLGTSQTIEQFVTFSVLLLLFKSSYLLVYPLVVELVGKGQRSAIAGTYQAVFHGAIIAATVAGAWMVNLEAPLFLFYWIAIADLIQLGLCLMVLRNTPTSSSALSEDERSLPGRQVGLGFMTAIGLTVLTFQLANNLVRPFFTEYVTVAQPFGVSLQTSSILFLIPSVMAIAAMPYIRKVAQPRQLPMLYSIGLGLLILSLYLQGGTTQLSVLVLSRVVYGFMLAVTQAVLELQLFEHSSQNRLHYHYSLVTAFANVGHLGAPLLASYLVNSYSLAAPLLAAATLCLLNLGFARLTIFRTVSWINLQPISVSHKET